MFGTLIVKLLMLGLPLLIDILYKFVKKKWGLELVSLADSNIVELDRQKKLELITSEDAEDQNMAAIIMATQQSPGIGKSWAKFINWVCYMNFLKNADKSKFKLMVDRVDRWFKDGKPKMTRKDFDRMGLYIPKRRP